MLAGGAGRCCPLGYIAQGGQIHNRLGVIRRRRQVFRGKARVLQAVERAFLIGASHGLRRFFILRCQSCHDAMARLISVFCLRLSPPHNSRMPYPCPLGMLRCRKCRRDPCASAAGAVAIFWPWPGAQVEAIGHVVRRRCVATMPASASTPPPPSCGRRRRAAPVAARRSGYPA